MLASHARRALLVPFLGLVVVAVTGATDRPAYVRPTTRATVLAQPVAYVAIGASDAYGVGVDDPATQSWPSVLASWLPAGSKLVNLGVPGITLHRALDVELPVAVDALAGHPGCITAASTRTYPRAAGAGRCGLVTVWLAVNDIASNAALDAYARDLDYLLRTLRARTGATVLVGNVPDLLRVPAFARRDRAGLAGQVAAWNGTIAASVRRNGAVPVDLYAGWRELAAHPEYVGPDGLHPTVAGYRRLALLFWQRVPR